MFSQAQLQAKYLNLEAIDGFLAIQLCQSLGSQSDVLQHLIMALSEALRNGHSCLPLAEVAGQTLWSTQGNVDSEIPEHDGFTFPDLAALIGCLDACSIEEQHQAPLVLENGTRLYLRRYWQYEHNVARLLLERMQTQTLTQQQQIKTGGLLSTLFPPVDGTDWQAQAVKDALHRKMSVISGGPGTGKTYTVARLIVALQCVSEAPLNIAMAAPTGKAKQRLLESINHAKHELLLQGIDPVLIGSIPEVAHTLHGLLGIRPNTLSVKHHSGHPLALDLLIIDEVSMVDLSMMAKLLDALPEHCKLVLVGDAEQLPSVAAGSILADIPSSAISYLHKSHRFDGEGGIGQLANSVMCNQSDLSWQMLQTNEALHLITDEYFSDWLQQMCEQFFVPMLKAQSLDDAFVCLNRFRILAATRGGDMGVDGLNDQIERLLSRRLSQVRLGQNYQGKPVMVTKNHHGLGLFNGDIGMMWAAENGQLDVCFAQTQGVRKINIGLLQDLETVYAMTIHKTQGSEFEHVGLVIAPQAERLLSSALLYTAITRAKITCSIKVSASLWRRAVANKAQRWSGLKQRLSR